MMRGGAARREVNITTEKTRAGWGRGVPALGLSLDYFYSLADCSYFSFPSRATCFSNNRLQMLDYRVLVSY